MLWIVRTDSLDDEVFRCDVSFGNEIDIAFVSDLCGAKVLHQQTACFARNLRGEVTHRRPAFSLHPAISFSAKRSRECAGFAGPSRPTSDRPAVRETRAGSFCRTSPSRDRD